VPCRDRGKGHDVLRDKKNACRLGPSPAGGAGGGWPSGNVIDGADLVGNPYARSALRHIKSPITSRAGGNSDEGPPCGRAIASRSSGRNWKLTSWGILASIAVK